MREEVVPQQVLRTRLVRRDTYVRLRVGLHRLRLFAADLPERLLRQRLLLPRHLLLPAGLPRRRLLGGFVPERLLPLRQVRELDLRMRRRFQRVRLHAADVP